MHAMFLVSTIKFHFVKQSFWERKGRPGLTIFRIQKTMRLLLVAKEQFLKKSSCNYTREVFLDDLIYYCIKVQCWVKTRLFRILNLLELLIDRISTHMFSQTVQHIFWKLIKAMRLSFCIHRMAVVILVTLK